MKNFGAVIGQFGSLAIGHLRQHGGVGNQARIGGHDAIDVGPNPQFGRFERGGQNGRREIRAAAAQGSRPAIGGSTVEAGDDRQHAFVQQRKKPRARFRRGLVHYRRSVSENCVGNDQLGGVHRSGRGALGIQERGNEQRREPLAHRYRLIHRTRWTVVQHEHAARNALKLAQQIVNPGAYAFLRGARQQIAASFLVALFQFADGGGEARRIAGLGVLGGVQQ